MNQDSDATERNMTVACRFYEEVCNQRNIDLADELLVADYVHHDPSLPAELQRGRDNHKKLFGMFLSAFPDLHGTIEDQFAYGDKVVERLRWQGKHQGELQGIPPSGRHVDFTMMSIHRFIDGKIVEGWVNFDMFGMMQQIGAIPMPHGVGV
ncbi:MAG: hypothetical protein NVS2B16_30890 [Chloroflexota bacterium]